MTYKTTIQVLDKTGFQYEVKTEHRPNVGVSIAYYQGSRIANREIGRARRPPQSDSEQEWEVYDQYIAEWCDAADADLSVACKLYFNAQ